MPQNCVLLPSRRAIPRIIDMQGLCTQYDTSCEHLIHEDIIMPLPCQFLEVNETFPAGRLWPSALNEKAYHRRVGWQLVMIARCIPPALLRHLPPSREVLVPHYLHAALPASLMTVESVDARAGIRRGFPECLRGWVVLGPSLIYYADARELPARQCRMADAARLPEVVIKLDDVGAI